METLYPSSYLSSSSLFMQESRSSSSEWTKEENKQFESALAQYDEKTPDRWLRIAAMIPGKTVWDVMKQYKELVEDVGEIEAGNVPIPGYPASSFTLDLMDDRSFDDMYRKKSSTARNSSDQERKKGVPWTEEEHKRFLMGLVKYGKGDWRNISRNFVITKTPTQVASHAQKYFMRQLPGGKDKRRPSIHDITTVNLADTSTISENDNSNDPALLNSCPKNISSQHKSTCGQRIMVFNSTLANNSCEIPLNHSIKMGQNVYASGHYGAYSKPHKSMLSRHQVIG